MAVRKPIFVTGSHRSGTTWVGKMLAASPRVGYIQEPFNIDFPRRQGIFAARVPYWFAYITTENGAAFYQPLKDTLSFRYNVGAELAVVKSPKDVARLLRDSIRLAWQRARHLVPLMKDPLAMFSAEWLTSTFDMRTIVMIRHPAAFISSLRKLNWRHDFTHFLRQPLLMRDHLHPFEAEMQACVRKEHDQLFESALLWKIIHHMIVKYKKAHEDWIFMRHEDIALDPQTHFSYLYKRCDLDFSPQVQQVIKEYSDPANPGESRKGVMFDKRDSKSTAQSWRKKFTSAELVQLRKQTEDIAHEFYGDNDW